MILDAPELRVADVRCQARHSAWSAEEPVGGPSVVLVRSGAFRRRVDGTESVIDRATAYVQRPASVQQVAHPWGGDTCTVIHPSASAFGNLAEPIYDSTDAPVVLPAAIDADHRVLLARARNGAEEFELVERATVLVTRLTEALRAEGARPARRVNTSRARRLRDQVCQALDENIDVRLPELARRIDVSPCHLSRTFRRAMGMTLTRYRRQLRLEMAIERLEAGDADLARLAADLGFADQAHFTRALRTETSATPGQLRALLGTPSNRGPKQ
jgi:AraC-like DNA-binding protein